MSNQSDDFIIALKELCRKYNVVINSEIYDILEVCDAKNHEPISTYYFSELFHE